MRLKSLGQVAVVALLLGAATGTAHAADTTVEMLATEFSPENVTVQVGDTVTWVNRDSAVHDSVARDPLVTWNTGYVEPNAEAAFTFTAAATYFYHCRIHPGMTGRVIVAALAPPATDTIPTVAVPKDSHAPLVALAAALVAVLAIRRTRAEPV